jgi:hypothetical protein
VRCGCSEGPGRWLPEFNEVFRGHPVLLHTHNDAAGHAHEAEVGAALQGIASKVRAARYAELPENGDVSDLIEQRRKDGLDDKIIRTELERRFRDARVWEPIVDAEANGTNGTNGSGIWPEPDLSILSQKQLEPPALPLEVFGAYWSDWIRDHAAAKSCAPDYVAGGLLGGAGALIGNARWGSPWPGWQEPPLVWTNNVGTPSSGKSPGLDPVRDVLASIEADANTNYKDDFSVWDTKKREAKIRLEVWESDCKRALKDKVGMLPPKPQNAEEPSRPHRKRIITNDPTVEKVARLVLENPKGLMLFRDELAGWIGALDKYGGAGGDRAFYIESYGGRSYAVDRMKDAEPIVVPSLSVVIMGGIQPDRLATLVLSGDDDGLAARFIYLWPERIPPQRPRAVAPSGAKAKLLKLYKLQEQMDENGERIALRFDEDAAAALQKYRTQVAAAESETSGLYLSWLGKLPGMAVRLAIIFEHLLWCGDNEDSPAPQSISERAAVAAIAFLDDYAAPMARRCFGEAALPQVDRDAKVLARCIVSNAPKTVNSRDLRRAGVLSTKDAARYTVALAELEAAGWLRATPARQGDTVGRQRKDWAVNPKRYGGLE